ncbi:hypothetical protein D9M72_369280 [compost metagenome]
MGQPTRANAIDDFIDRAHAQGVFRHARPAIGVTPIQAHFLERLRGRGPSAQPVAVAKDRERLLEIRHAQLHGACGLVRLVMGVAIAAGKHLRHQLGCPQVQRRTGPDLLRRHFPQRLFEHELGRLTQAAQCHDRNAEMIAALPAIGAGHHAETERLDGLHGKGVDLSGVHRSG